MVGIRPAGEAEFGLTTSHLPEELSRLIPSTEAGPGSWNGQVCPVSSNNSCSSQGN